MHSVSQSASIRASKRLATSRRIMHAANQLTLERGYDGWTMEDLALAADVSRRTLFNYFPAKLDAVIGPMPTLPADALEVFRAQGPTGVLIDDCRVLAREVLDEEQLGSQDLRLHREVVASTPRLIVVVHQRFEQVAGELVEHILAREGEQFGAVRARLLVGLMVAVFDSCLGRLQDEHETDRPLAALFDEALDAARELLA